MAYIYEDTGWPDLVWDESGLQAALSEVRHRQGRLLGRMDAMGFPLRADAVLQTLTQDVLKSSEIEGEILDKDLVRSSVARRLGMDIGALTPVDRQVEGVVEMMLDATQRFDQPLTETRLFAWHAALFPTGWSGLQKITVGAWREDRDGPMQVVSGGPGREHVHFQAPRAEHLPGEMARFLTWFNEGAGIDPVLKAAIAHFWFVTIHPFEDGNGRIARAIADLALARADDSPQRFYSMSAQIRVERTAYYDVLETTQKGGLDITGWLQWFLSCLGKAIDGAGVVLGAVLDKAAFWLTYADVNFNERQRRMVERLLGGFEGKLTTSKWAVLAKCSQDTALRDIDSLVRAGVLTKESAGGRSTSYALAPWKR